MMTLNPEEVYAQYCEHATKRKKATLEKVHTVCKQQASKQTKDFSLKTIARLLAEVGGPTEQALRNKNGADYKALIQIWAEYCNTTIKKPPKIHCSTINDELLASITDPTIKSLVGILIAQNKKLKKENALLKEQSTFIIDMRSANSPMNAQLIPSINYLTDSEKDALIHAISDEHMTHMGWTIDEQGRVKEKGFLIYKAGYISAIKKIIKQN